MIIKRTHIFLRSRKKWADAKYDKDTITERVVRESWWLFGLIPLYVRDNVQTSNL